MGATGHFVLPVTPVKNTKPATTLLTINLLDGDQIKSTHTCQLDTPWIPEEAKEAYTVPGLAHTYFVFINLLCDTGCNVEYNAQNAE